MKTLTIRSFVTLAALGAISLFGASYQQQDLFPLTSGSSWTYDDGGIALVSQATDNNGVLSVVITNKNTTPHGPGYLSLVADGAEVQVTGYSQPNYIIVDGDMGYTPFVKWPMSLGRSWSNSGYSNGYLVTTTATVTDTNASVTIGGNTYDHCTEVSVIVSFPNGAPPQTGWVNNKHYFLPGVGCIKRILKSDNGSTAITQAIGWNIKGPSGVLVVRINGNGAVSPNYNGQVLQFGNAYTMTATAASGFLFNNWTSNLLPSTTNRTISFVMQSNLTWQADFVDVAKPTLAITAPMVNQRWSNALFTVKGTAKDNVQVSSVWCLTNGVWGLATTSNGWTNWTAGMTLSPGTNTVRAYAVDAAGNLSQIVTSRVIYVLSDRLTLRTNPAASGTVTGVTNGQWLEIDHTYLATAKVNVGFAFSNWTQTTNGTDWATSTVPALNFTMQSNLVLVASFLDVGKPTLTLKSPTANQQCSNALFTIKGAASDNLAVRDVQYNLNNAGWQEANGTTNWTADVTLAKGTNSLQVYAEDPTGNRSMTNRVTFVYNQFLMFKATYNGLFYPTNGMGATNCGALTLTLDGTTRGGFSGKISLEGTNLPLSGAFSQDLLALVSVPRPNKSPLALTLELNPVWTNSASQLIRSNVVTGAVADGANWVSDVLAFPGFGGKTNAYAGNYTLLIEGGDAPSDSPPGDGAGTVAVGGSGTVSVKGALADNTPFTSGTAISTDGLWPMFVSLYGGRGLFIGWMSCDTIQPMGSTNLWLKPALVPSKPINPDGFAEWPLVLLSKYTPPTAGRSAVNWTNGRVVLEFGNLPQSLTNYVVVSNGLVRVVGGAISNLTFAITNKDGTFGGSFKHPATNVPVKFSGVLVPAASGNDAFGGGWFVGSSQGGRVRFESAEGDRNPFAGTYSANYVNSTMSSLTIAVGPFGEASVVIKDPDYGVFLGSGSVSTNGELNAIATQASTFLSVYIFGQFSNQGGAVTVSGSVDGDVQVPFWMGNQVAPAGVNAFVGSWSGLYSGDESGTATATVAADGTVKGKAISPSCGTVTLTGNVSFAGLGALHGTGSGVCAGYGVTWEGVFFLYGTQPIAEGTWISNSGLTGQWSIHR